MGEESTSTVRDDSHMMGFMIGCHGVQKVFGLLDGESPAQGLFLLAGVIETVGGPLMMLGLFTSPVALLLSGEMAVAYFMVHASFRFWPLLKRRRDCRRQLLRLPLYRCEGSGGI
jgi:uncharacterized membrane protein YphA (DoxX/SURF4 family)